MKLKKAKKMLKSLGIDQVDIKERVLDGEEFGMCEIYTIDTGEDHSMDNAKITDTTVNRGMIEITYDKPSKKKKKKSKKEKYGEEVARIQRNLKHIQTGEGEYELSPEEIEKRENNRRNQERNNKRYEENDREDKEENKEERREPNNRNQDSRNDGENPRNNKRRSYKGNKRETNPSSKEIGTDNVKEVPDKDEKKEE